MCLFRSAPVTPGPVHIQGRVSFKFPLPRRTEPPWDSLVSRDLTCLSLADSFGFFSNTFGCCYKWHHLSFCFHVLFVLRSNSKFRH